MRTLTLLTLVISLLCTPALAHPGHPLAGSGLLAGLSHPWSGIDHLLTMIQVGTWGASLGRRAAWIVPASFLALMTVGAAAALSGWAPPHIEAGIAASLLVLGLAVAAAHRLPVAVAAVLAGIFAIFHGAAHGQELAHDAPFAAYACGFLLSTAALHAVGVLIGLRCREHSILLPRVLGVLGAAVGLGLAMT